jgi:hypothetical protein
MQKKLAAATLGLLLAFSKPALAGAPGVAARTSWGTATAKGPMADALIGKTGSERRLSSAWEGGTCEINGNTLTVKTGAGTSESLLPQFNIDRGEMVPIQLSCSGGRTRIAYRNRIEVYGSPASLKDGAGAVSHVDFRYNAVEVAFFDNGTKAYVAFDNGLTAVEYFNADGTLGQWVSKKEPEKGRAARAVIKRSGPYTHVLFPETGSFMISYANCKGVHATIEDGVHGGAASIECTGSQCDVFGEGEVLKRLIVPCPPEAGAQVTKKAK